MVPEELWSAVGITALRLGVGFWWGGGFFGGSAGFWRFLWIWEVFAEGGLHPKAVILTALQSDTGKVRERCCLGGFLGFPNTRSLVGVLRGGVRFLTWIWCAGCWCR